MGTDLPRGRLVTQISRVAHGASLEVRASGSIGVRHRAVAFARSVSDTIVFAREGISNSEY